MKHVAMLTVFAALAIPACKGGGGGGGGAQAQAEADKVWSERCTTCHGNAGAGDGPGAAALTVKPRSFTDAEWQAKTKDEQIAKVIVEGGAANGLDAGMAPNPDLKAKPDVVNALVKKIRKLRQ